MWLHIGNISKALDRYEKATERLLLQSVMEAVATSGDKLIISDDADWF